MKTGRVWHKVLGKEMKEMYVTKMLRKQKGNLHKKTNGSATAKIKKKLKIKERNIQTDRNTKRQTDILTARKTYPETNKLTDRQAGNQAGGWNTQTGVKHGRYERGGMTLAAPLSTLPLMLTNGIA